LSLPVMPPTHTWVRGGPMLARAVRVAMFEADRTEVWVWDEDTDTVVTDLLDRDGNPVTTAVVEDGWVDGIGVPVAVKVASFSVGANGRRYEALPVQFLRDAAAAADSAAASAEAAADSAALVGAPADTAIATAVNASGSQTRTALNSTYETGTAKVVHVASGGNDSRPGLTASTAKATIAAALADIGSGGGTVRLAVGTHAVTSDLTVPDNVVIQGAGPQSTKITFAGCTMLVQQVTKWTLRDLSVSRTGTAGPAITIKAGATNGAPRWYMDNVHVTGSTGTGIRIEDCWVGTMVNPIVQGCVKGIEIVAGPLFSTGMNSITLVGGEIQNNSSVGLMVDTAKQVNILGTAIEGNAVGLGIGASVEALNIQGYFEGNTGGHIVGVAGASTAGNAQAITVQAGSYFLKGTGGPDGAINLGRVRWFNVEDGVSFRGYSGNTTPLITVADVGDSVRARGYVGLIRTDAPVAQVLSNGCYYFGRKSTRAMYLNAALPAGVTTTLAVPWGKATDEKVYVSSRTRVVLHVQLPATAGNMVLSVRGRSAAGTTVGTQKNLTLAATVGYNRLVLESDPGTWGEDIAYVEVLRTGGGSDTAGSATLLGVDLVTFENPAVFTT